MGLPAAWLRVVDAIGVDAFVAMWRIVDAEPAFRGDDGVLQLKLRPFRSYLRFQRNRYIEALAGEGKSPQEIIDLVQTHLCERISRRHIYRLMNE